MTAQVTEVLHYKGEQLSMRTEPLSDYFAQMCLPKPGRYCQP